MENKENQVFIRSDLDRASGNVAFYRMDKGMKDFLNLCREKHGEVEAIVLTKESDDDSGNYHWNIGFALPEAEAK